MTWLRGTKKLTECPSRVGPSQLSSWSSEDQEGHWPVTGNQRLFLLESPKGIKCVHNRTTKWTAVSLFILFSLIFFPSDPIYPYLLLLSQCFVWYSNNTLQFENVALASSSNVCFACSAGDE